MDISPRLSTLLDRSLQYRITEIVAPAGFGKSTLLVEMASKHGFLVGRVRPNPDAVLALMRALCQAVSAEIPDLLRALPDAFENASAGSKLDLASWFAQTLRGRRFKIALDDLHHLGEDNTSWTLLAHLIETSREEDTQWVVASRTWPRLPTVNWIASGEQGATISEHDLAFSIDDTEHFASSMGVDLSPKDAARVDAITKGWPLLSIYALKLLDQGLGFANLVDTITGRGVAAIADHLIARLDSDDHSLLLAVALYDGALPEELEICDRGGAQGVYRLAVAGIPVTQGNDRRWRVHDVLREHLLVRDPELRVATGDRISTALENQKDLNGSLRISLAASSPDIVNALLERHARYFIDAGDPQLLHGALSMFPHRIVEKSPHLTLLRGLEEMLRGEPQIAIGFLRHAVAIGQGSFKTYAMARLLQGLVNWDGHADEAAAVAVDLASAPSPPEPEAACEILGHLAQAFSIFGDINAAQNAIRSAIELLPQLSDPLVEARTYTRAGRVALSASRFDEAEGFTARAITIGERHRLFETLFWAFQLRLHVMAANREADAVMCAREAAKNAAHILSKAALYSAEASLFAFVCRAGDLDEARQLQRRLLPVPSNYKARAGAPVLITAAQLEMQEGNYWKAAAFLADVRGFGEATVDGIIVLVREILFLTQTALLNQLTGNEQAAVKTALAVLDACSGLRLDGMANSAVPEVEISQITAAVILGAHSRMAEAETVLDNMARNGHERYRRELAVWVTTAFVDRDATPSDEVLSHAKGVVELIRRVIANVERVSLTLAERRVLESLALGRSSKEVAALSGKSVKTVDNQVSAILRKLQARSRGEAVARARRAGLLATEHEEVLKA
jgi:ATP/maltotriose-dependent transcriptional regulator MalT